MYPKRLAKVPTFTIPYKIHSILNKSSHNETASVHIGDITFHGHMKT